jgi:hypothetical protein
MLGANKVNVSFSYTRVNFSRFEGTDLNSFRLDLPRIDVNDDGILGPPGSLVELDTVAAFVDITLEQDDPLSQHTAPEKDQCTADGIDLLR